VPPIRDNTNISPHFDDWVSDVSSDVDPDYGEDEEEALAAAKPRKVVAKVIIGHYAPWFLSSIFYVVMSWLIVLLFPHTRPNKPLKAW
jgi:hypothetical protein